MITLKRIIQSFTPDRRTLCSPVNQAKTIQDLYDQIKEFYRWLSSPEYKEEFKGKDVTISESISNEEIDFIISNPINI